jgi:hypothetical protein
MTVCVTAQFLFDGTFSTEAVAATASALVQRLHDEAMATIADLADNWDHPPVTDEPAVDADEPVTYQDPASWSAADDEDERYEAEEERVLPMPVLPALLRRPRATAAAVAAAATDEFDAPVTGERHLAGV